MMLLHTGLLGKSKDRLGKSCPKPMARSQPQVTCPAVWRPVLEKGRGAGGRWELCPRSSDLGTRGASPEPLVARAAGEGGTNKGQTLQKVVLQLQILDGPFSNPLLGVTFLLIAFCASLFSH